MISKTEAQTSQPTLVATIARLAGVIGATHYPTGDRAALRRWAPAQPVPLAFYRLWMRHAGEELPTEAQTDAWMALAWGMATMRAHDPKRPLGQALAEARYSEGRLERLLGAPDAVRIELFMGAVRFLAAKNDSFNWLDAATFLLASNAQARERIDRRIAQAFYRHLPKD